MQQRLLRFPVDQSLAGATDVSTAVANLDDQSRFRVAAVCRVTHFIMERWFQEIRGTPGKFPCKWFVVTMAMVENKLGSGVTEKGLVSGSEA